MGALKIDCYCNERQMSNIVNMVVNHLNNADLSDVSDLDDVVDGVRICVEFDSYMDTVKLKSSEILDSDWDLLYEDTAVFTSRLKSIMNNYNRSNKASLKQAADIRRYEISYQ